MAQHLRRAIAVTAAVALPLGLAGVADAATDPAVPPTFTKTEVASLVGASFVVAGDVVDDNRPEIVASAFGPYFGPAPAGPGTVTMYRNAVLNSQVPTLDKGSTRVIVPASAGIFGPNQPTLSDVDGDGDIDVIVPGGNFFRSFVVQSPPFAGVGSGTLTWWEQRANGSEWLRHDVVANSTFTGTKTAVNVAPPATPPNPPDYQLIGSDQRNYSYHGVQHADIDGDGRKDLVTVGEDAGNPGTPIDDIVTLQYFQGLGGGNFGPAVDLGPGGGSLPHVADVDGDNKLDVVSAQYFGPVTCQAPFPFAIPTVCPFGAGLSPSAASFVWFQQTGDPSDGLSAADFTKRPISSAQGPSFQITPVANLRGTGVSWVATNHTNKNVPFPPFAFHPEPAVYELTPQADPTLPWTATKLTGTGAFTVTGGVGQAAPGGVGSGDLDGDGDIDLAVSGDGDRRVFWLEQKGDGSFSLNAMPDSDGYGQAGGNVVIDLNRDGKNEAIWGSFDKSQVSIWQR